MDSPRPNKRKKIHSNDENNEDIVDYQRLDHNIVCEDDDDNISDSELVRASQILESKFNHPNVHELSEIHNTINRASNHYMHSVDVISFDVEKIKADNFQKTGEIKMLRDKFKKHEIEMSKLRNEKIELVKKLSKQNDETEKAFRKQIESKELEIKFKTQEVIEITMKYKALESKFRKDNSSSHMPPPPVPITAKKQPILSINESNDHVISDIISFSKPKDVVYMRKMKLKTKLNFNNSRNGDVVIKNEFYEINSVDYNTYYYQLIDKFKHSLLHFNSLFSDNTLINIEKARGYIKFENSLHELNKNINHLLHKVNYSQRLSLRNHDDKFQMSSNLCKKYMNLVLNNLNKTIKIALVAQSTGDTSDVFINISYLLLEILINLCQYETLIFSAKNSSNDLAVSQFSFNLKHELCLLISQLLKSSNFLNFNTLNCILVVFNQLLSKPDCNFWLQLLHNNENKNLCLFYLFYEKCTKFFLEESYKLNNSNASCKYENRFIFSFLTFFDLYAAKLSRVNNSTSMSCLCKKDMISSFSCVIDYLTIKKYILADNLKISNNGDLNNSYLINLCKLMQVILLIVNNCKLTNDDLLFETIRDDYRYKNFFCLMFLIVEAYLPKRFKYLNFNNVKAFIKSSLEIFL